MRTPPKLSRRALILGAILGFGFLLISGILARALSVDGAERSAVTALIQAEARGDAAGMLEQIAGCKANTDCRSAVERDAASLRRPGAVTILELNPSAGFSLGSTHGFARVAWKTPSSLAIVQCVEVRRAGSVLSGLTVELLAIRPRIHSDGVCPGGS